MEHQTLGLWVIRPINPASQSIILKIVGFVVSHTNIFCKKEIKFKKNNLNVFLIRFWRHWVLFSQDIWHVGFFFVFMYLLSASIWCNLPLSWWTYNYVGICKKKIKFFTYHIFWVRKTKELMVLLSSFLKILMLSFL